MIGLMQFRIADTFTDSLAKLTGEEQAAKDELERMGYSYNVICNLEQAAALVDR